MLTPTSVSISGGQAVRFTRAGRDGHHGAMKPQTRFLLSGLASAASTANALRPAARTGRLSLPSFADGLPHSELPLPYGTFEASYDSRYNTINRLRLSVGAATRFNSHVMLDTYFARQRDTRSDASQLQSFGMTLNLTY